MNKKGAKIIASMLVFVMMFTYMSIISQVVATTVSTLTNNENVEFDAYLKEDETKTYAAIKTIGEENYLYAKVTVKNAGYLKNANITFENPNFEIPQDYTSKEIAKVENNKIILNQIKNGETVELAIPVNFKETEYVSAKDLNNENKVSLSATYIDSKGKEKEIAKDITVTLAWTKEKEAQLDMQISKFIPYELNNKKGVMLQTILTSNLKDNTLPVKNEKIEIFVPTIENIKPETINVVANTTKATNGDEQGLNFTNENYTYNKEEGKLTIVAQNKQNEQGQISWKKQAKDEFIITYIYGENIEVPEKGTQIEYKVNSELTVLEASETHARKTITRQETLKNQIGAIVDFETKTNVETISKGQIYANYDANKKYETTYEEKITANISMADLIDTVIINANEDNIIKQNDAKQSAQSNTYYKQIVVEKTNLNKILSEEGFIKIYNGETLITTINKETEANEEGKIIVDLAQANLSQIKIETSDVKTEGKLELTLTKAIKQELSYTAGQMQEIKALELNTKLTANSSNATIVENTKQNQITFTEPTSKAEITVEPSNLSTVIINNDVKIKVALKTDALDCKLYKNPTLNIILPKYIESINIKNVEVLFETEGTKLALKNHTVMPNADGTKTLQITLEGTQTEYSLGAVSKGLNVVVTSDITVNKLTPNKQEQITMVYTNNNINAEEKQEVANVNFVAPTGIVTISSVSNYAENANALVSINSEEKVATMKTMQPARTARFEMNLINNYTNTIDNISILGRVPFKSNKDIIASIDLGTTFDTNLANAITVAGIDASKVKVYYSENGNATKDLNNIANGWTLTPSNLSKVKSYLIVLENYVMQTGEGISFGYDAQLPANLQHNESAYQTYVAYFNNNIESGAIEDKAKAAKLGITTGRGPVLEASISSNKNEQEEVLTGEFIKYTVTAKNTGTENAENVVVNVNLPEELTYVEKREDSLSGYKTIASGGKNVAIDLGTVEVGKTVSKELLMRVENILEDTLKVETSITITSSNIDGNIKADTIKNTLAKTYFITSSGIKDSKEIVSKDEVYTYYISALSSSTIDNREETKVEVNIPQEVEYQNIKILKQENGKTEDITNQTKCEYNSKTRKLVVDLGTIDGLNVTTMYIDVKAKELPENVYEKVIQADARISGKDVRSQKVELPSVEIDKIGLKVTQTSTITNNAEISAYEDFKYVFEIENLSNTILDNIKLTDILPSEVIFNKIVVTYENGVTKNSYETDENSNPIVNIRLTEKSKAKVEVEVLANDIEQDTNITNYLLVKYDGIEDIKSNSINHTIKKYKETINEEENKTKRIMGQVWKDENGDGLKDENEEKLSNIEVLLFNNQTGTYAVDENNNILKVKTSEDGTYTFKDILAGKYTVIFLYDAGNYSATAYRKANVDETKNSDAVDTKITLDGIARIAAITEEIEITNSNIYNIDLGLVANKKFDLKLDKTVTKITVQDSDGTKVYEYKDSKLAKRDLVGKKINDTTIIVEYKIAVTNEGGVAGYVKKIVDYMPEEMKFSAELNRDWYVASNGAIYNSSLANTIINPGETKEVTLSLSKKMSENTLGLINNTAEIYEAYNDLGLEDIDSKVANKVSEEDDMSSADILITVKTGETIMFIGLSLTIITIIGMSAYFIKKKVLH